MPYRSPGLGDPRLDWILIQIRQAQSTLDARISEALALPDTEPSKAKRIARLNQMKREVDSAFIQLDSQMSLWASRDLSSLYQQGHTVGAIQTATGFDFTLPHREALDLISNDAYDDIATRLLQVREGFGSTVELQKMFEALDASQIGSIQTKSRAAVTQALLTGADPRVVAKQLAQDLWSDGINIIDSSGRQWNPEAYTRMLVRTKSANAYNAGSLNKYTEEGVTRVRVFDGVEHDPECAEANGQIWSMRFAMNNVVEHPNCRRAFAPEQGDGPVDRDTAAKYLVVFDRVELAVGAVAALRAFRNTGEINTSSTLARLLIETGEILTGTNLPVIDVFLQGLLSGGFSGLDVWIESYIDPLLYASGIIRNIPPRAGLQAALRPDDFVSTITKSIKEANKEAFGVEFHPGIRSTLDRLDALGREAVETAVAVSHLRGGEKYVDWVIEHALDYERMGQITAEVIRQVVAGERDTLQQLIKNAAGFVDDAREIRRLYIRSALATRLEAEELYLALDEVLVQAATLLHHNIDINNLPAVLDFMTKYSELNPIDVERMIAFWSAKNRRINFNEYEVKKIAEMFQAAAIAQNRVLGRIEELDGAVRSRGQRQLLMAAPSGPDIPSVAPSLWDLNVYEESVGRLKNSIEDVVGTNVSHLDKNELQAWKDFMIMIQFEENKWILDDMLQFEFVKPSFRRAELLEDFINPDDVDTPKKALAAFFGIFEDMEIQKGELLFDGVKATDTDVKRILEVLQWFDAERFFQANYHAHIFSNAWDVAFITRHINQFPLADQRTAVLRLWENLSSSVSDVLLGPTAKAAPIAQPFSNLGDVLIRIYGRSNVTSFNGGINGTVFKVTDDVTGQVMVVKRTTSAHTGGPPAAITSNAMSNFFAQRLGDAEVVPTRFLSVTDQGDQTIVVMPFFEGDVWSGSTRLVRHDTTRKFSLLDRLTMERDSHGHNWMVNPHTSNSVAIDREASFGLFIRGPSDGFTQFPAMGMTNAANHLYLERTLSAWDVGDDFLVGNSPKVELVRLTGAEASQLTGYLLSDLVNLNPGARRAILNETGVVINSANEAFIPAGRIGLANIGGDSGWYVSHHLTESELRLVDDLLGQDQSLFDDAVEYLREVTKDLSDTDKAHFVSYWNAGDMNEAVIDAAAEILERTAARADALVNGGVMNITGGLSKYVDPESGRSLKHGTVAEFVDNETGEIVRGTVVTFYERPQLADQVHVVVIEDIGTGLTEAQLRQKSLSTRQLNLNDWSFGELAEETPKGKAAQYKAALEEFQEPTKFDPTDARERLRPIIDDNGLHVGFQEEIVEFDFGEVYGGWVYAVDQADGEKASIALADLVHHDDFRKLINVRLQEVPAQYRPSRIAFTTQKITTADGKAAFGMFDPDTGVLRVSLAPLFDSADMELVPGNKRSFFLSVPEGTLFDPEEWLRSLDLEPIGKVLDHELGHAVQTGIERQSLSRAAYTVFNHLQGQNPRLTMRDLEVLAGTLLPEGFDTTGYASNIASLVAHRAGIIEDVINTNMAFEARLLLESGVASGVLPPWARAVYAGILRGEPEAHHEMYAEIWKLVQESGFTSKGIKSIADDLGLDETGEELIVKFLNRHPHIRPPRDWDMGSEEFAKWLSEVLDSDADRIIPLERHRNRRLWSAERYSVPDIRTRVFDTPIEEGGGGITINLVTGEEPRVGFSVANKANEREVKGVVARDQFEEVIRQYIKDHKKQLSEPEWELGLWLDPDGTLYLDTVHIFDDEIDAVAYGFRQQQRAMYHLDANGPGEGATINLLDSYTDIDDYIKQRGIKIEYEEYLPRTRKIGGVTRVTGTFDEKIAEEFFEEGGTFRVMSTDWMTDADREKIFRELRERYNIQMSVGQGKRNLETILERGLELQKTDPERVEEFTLFYRIWRDSFIDAAAATKGRSVEIPVHRFAAAASGMSASMRADVNLRTVLAMGDIISRDLRMTKKFVEATKEAIGASMERALLRGDLTEADRLAVLQSSYRVGQRVNIMPSEMRIRAIAGISIAEGTQRIPAPRSWKFLEKSAAVLVGDIEPHQALTDTKFRPFYNNIIDPTDIFTTREVTIDFVMANAFFMAVGMNDLDHTRPTVRGIQAGLRPVISDTIRVLMDEGWGARFGITNDLEMQALLWGLFRHGQDEGWWGELPTVLIKKKPKP